MIDNSLSMGGFFYCAPLFHTYKDLELNYNSDTILDSSIWIIPNGTRITDTNRHNITYNTNGSRAHLHSEPQEVDIFKPDDSNILLKKRKIGNEYIKKLSENLSEALVDTIYDKKYSHLIKKQKTDLEKVQTILGQVFNISWILLP